MEPQKNLRKTKTTIDKLTRNKNRQVNDSINEIYNESKYSSTSYYLRQGLPDIARAGVYWSTKRSGGRVWRFGLPATRASLRAACNETAGI